MGEENEKSDSDFRLHPCIRNVKTDGHPKQLLRFEGVPMLEHTIRKLLHHPFHNIHAIIGPHSKEIMDSIKIDDKRFEWKTNDKYQEGQSAALKEAA